MKLLCSIGPKTNTLESLLELYREGMTGIRFNFSHIHYDAMDELLPQIKQEMPDMEIIQDLHGQKLRVSRKFQGEVRICDGERVLFCPEERYENFSQSDKLLIIPVYFEGDFSRMASVKEMFMKDATMEFDISAFKDGLIYANVRRGGVVRAEKGINAPGMTRIGLGLSQKDKEDIEWGSTKEFDVVCLSFVTTKEEVLECKNVLQKAKVKKMPQIWAKIETREGLENFDTILEHVDGIMLGRGDLSAEIGVYDIPYFQSKVLKKMQKSGKELIMATYVLETMRFNPIPSVAECNDIWNCLNANVTGFLLTAEVGVGKYPALAMKALKKMVDTFQKQNGKQKKAESSKPKATERSKQKSSRKK